MSALAKTVRQRRVSPSCPDASCHTAARPRAFVLLRKKNKRPPLCTANMLWKEFLVILLVVLLILLLVVFLVLAVLLVLLILLIILLAHVCSPLKMKYLQWLFPAT